MLKKPNGVHSHEDWYICLSWFPARLFIPSVRVLCNYFHHIKALLTPCVHWWVFNIFKLCCDFLQNLIILVNVFYLYYLCSVLSGKLSVKLYHNSYVCQRSSWTNWIITDNPRFLFGSSTAAYKSQNRFVCHVDIKYISFL